MLSTQICFRRRSRSRLLCRLARLAAVATAFGVLLWPAGVLAADQPLDGATPSSSGMPGGQLVVDLLGWLMWLALAASGAAILYGAASWRGWGSASAGRAVEGKTYVIAGAIGALVVGLAPTIVSMLFAAGGK